MNNKSKQTLLLRGVKEHNLKNLSLEFPKGKLIVISGPSGSGKSSLVFDVIGAEAQRRFIETLSGSARQFFEQVPRPDIEHIEGLCPAVLLNGLGSASSPRSTVGTLTEVSDHLRVLFSLAGTAICHYQGQEIQAFSVEEIQDRLRALPEGTKLQLLAPVSDVTPEDLDETLEKLRKDGFTRVRLNGVMQLLEDVRESGKAETVQLEIVVDRLKISPTLGSRLSDSVELCLGYAGGSLIALKELPDGTKEEEELRTKFSCSVCSLEIASLTPALFSFNTPEGACNACQGLGVVKVETIPVEMQCRGEDLSFLTTASSLPSLCPACKGSRLSAAARLVTFSGRNLVELNAMSIFSLREWLDGVFSKQSGEVNKYFSGLSPLLAEIVGQLDSLIQAGLGYLSLSRATSTLSRGELQRVRLATQLSSAFSGVFYLLDEPTSGLHPIEQQKLLEQLRTLRDLGNTVIVVEHSRQLLEGADIIFDMGPGAGELGGRVVASGLPGELCQVSDSATGSYLAGNLTVYSPRVKRKKSAKLLKLKGANTYNLKSVDVDIPLGLLTAVHGVSGSGKSSLIQETLYQAVRAALDNSSAMSTAFCRSLTGIEEIESVAVIDQQPLGRNARSTPATYTGAFDLIRDLFASVPESRARGWKAGRFSFNGKDGRCERCQGAGLVALEMQLLPDLYAKCTTCGGKRFNRDTLEIRYKGLSIAEVLDLSVEEAARVFAAVPKLSKRLHGLAEVGLGYLGLGQSATTLSGGEAQRVKLAKELAKTRKGHTLYLFDEPTAGLHPKDIDRLMQILHRLVDQGNTVVVVEHSIDVVQSADWCIELGPGAGEDGGRIVFSGTPEELAKASTPTSRYLA